MIGMILSQLRRRRGRALSLALGILVAATGFTLLTSAVTTSRAQTTGLVRHNARSDWLMLAAPLPEEWLTADQITFLCRGWAHGIAREAALKMREATQSWTEAYPSLEYRHGPISIALPGRLVWHFGADEDGLRADVAATGAHFVDHPEDPQADLVRVQRLAEAVAARKGLDPDRPRALTRSVILDRLGS